MSRVADFSEKTTSSLFDQWREFELKRALGSILPAEFNSMQLALGWPRKYSVRMRKQIFALVTLILVGGALFYLNTDPAAIESASSNAGSVATASAIELVPRTVTFRDGSTATFRLPKGFDITVAAEDLGKARFMAKSPDGRIFIPDMINWNLSHEGKMHILDGWNPETRTFAKVSTYLTKLRGPNDIAFYTDVGGQSWIYYTLTEGLFRYPYKAAETTPSGERELVYSFPNRQSPDADGVVWHVTRTILFDKDTLYVSVGSGCNLCEQEESDLRAQILVMNPDGSNVRTYANGIKNAVGITLADGVLYATENGVDHLGNEKPDDLMFKIEEGKHYGWPYCYELDGKKYDDMNRSWKHKSITCADVPMSFASFGEHAAPLGVTYFGGSHPLLRDSFLVALHGSHQAELRDGYKVVRVSRDGKQDTFMDGFMTKQGTRVARPVHILQVDGTSFYLSDDHGGRVFYIYATDEM